MSFAKRLFDITSQNVVRHTMKKLLIVFSIVFLFVGICNADEKDILKSFEKIKANTETGLTLRQYNELLADVQVEINIFKRGSNANPNFIIAAEKCLKKYKAAWAYWKMGNDMGEKRGPYDLGMQKSWNEGAKLLDEVYKTLE